jgi:hypothetical protein
LRRVDIKIDDAHAAAGLHEQVDALDHNRGQAREQQGLTRARAGPGRAIQAVDAAEAAIRGAAAEE